MPASTTANRKKCLLAADVGGTKTLLQLRTIDGTGHATTIAEQRYPSGDFASLEELVAHFLRENGQLRPDSACLAVAGPVQQHGEYQSASLTNLPWQLDSRMMSERLGIPLLALLNDFQAIGYSIDELGAEDLAPLHRQPVRRGAPRLVVGAGTGLGVGTLYPDNGRYISYPGEGGHMAFAPRDSQQLELLQFLQQQYDRVSWERLVSGAGLVNIYRFLLPPSQRERDPLLAQADAAAAIGQHAGSAAHPVAASAVRLFCRLYGAFTGDLALTTLPAGGIYIAGGIAPKLLSYLQEGPFVAAYLDKGRMHQLVHGFPVQVITNPRCGLLGAAHFAARL
ncbi:MAG TPA: glucokinase [Gammaproteobacteria bacterium]